MVAWEKENVITRVHFFGEVKTNYEISVEKESS